MAGQILCFNKTRMKKILPAFYFAQDKRHYNLNLQ